MNELDEEIAALIDKLNKSNPAAESTEHIVSIHLEGLIAAMDTTDDLWMLESRFAELEQFWLSSVEWCSQLSKDIERIIIIYQELL